MIKNEPSSRKLITLDRRRKDTLNFEMINDRLALARMKGDENVNYWTMLDIAGHMVPLPQKMQDILKICDWEELQIR